MGKTHKKQTKSRIPFLYVEINRNKVYLKHIFKFCFQLKVPTLHDIQALNGLKI